MRDYNKMNKNIRQIRELGYEKLPTEIIASK